LFAANQPSNYKYIQCLYTNTNAAAPVLSATCSFKAVRPGTYVLRFFQEKSYTPVVSSAPFVVGPTVVSLDATVQDDNVIVRYALDNPSKYPTYDWIGVYEKDKRNKRYIVSAYGNKEGEITVRAPRQPGQYEVRLFMYNAKYNEQAIARFIIPDNDQISIVETSPAVESTPSASFPVTWSLSVPANQPITVSFTARTVEPASSDWVGLYAVEQVNNKAYLDSRYTNGQTAGTLSFTAPQQAGVYEFRLFMYSAGKYLTFRKSRPFFVSVGEKA